MKRLLIALGALALTGGVANATDYNCAAVYHAKGTSAGWMFSAGESKWTEWFFVSDTVRSSTRKTWAAHYAFGNVTLTPRAKADAGYTMNINISSTSRNKPLAIRKNGKTVATGSCEINVTEIAPAPRAPTVLDGIKADCYAKWGRNYDMVKFCIDNQVEAYSALQNY